MKKSITITFRNWQGRAGEKRSVEIYADVALARALRMLPGMRKLVVESLREGQSLPDMTISVRALSTLGEIEGRYDVITGALTFWADKWVSQDDYHPLDLADEVETGW